MPASVAVAFEETLDARKLKEAFGRALCDYPVFAGSFSGSGTQWFLDCDGSGARFEVVERTETLAEGLRVHPGTYWKKIVPDVRLGLSARNTLMHVRLNQYPEGGTIVGLSWNHAIGDWVTGLNFLRAWSDHAAGRPVDPPLLVTDRDRFMDEHCDDPYDSSRLKFASYTELAGLAFRLLMAKRRQRLAVLYFDDEEVAAIRTAVQNGSEARLSTNDTLMAHLIGVVNELDPRDQPRQVSITVNFRKRRGIADNAVGNYINLLTLDVEPDIAPAQFAQRMRSALATWQPPYQRIREFMDDKGKDCLVYRFLPDEIDAIDGAALSNVNRFGLFDVDFGISPVALFLPIVATTVPWYGIISEGFRGVGTQVAFNVPAPVAEQLKQPQTQAKLHRYRTCSTQLASEHMPWLV